MDGRGEDRVLGDIGTKVVYEDDAVRVGDSSWRPVRRAPSTATTSTTS